MIKTQRIIKYFAIAFAIFLIFNIISLIMYGIMSLGTVFDVDNNDSKIQNLEKLEVTENILVLDIEVASSNIIIKEGTTLDIETNNEYINLKQKNNKVTITEKKRNWLNINNTNNNLIIYVPSNYIFDEVSIEAGAGKVEVETITTKKLDLDLGAGKVSIDNLTVSQNTEIDGGAGEITITNGNINNLDLDMGVGKLTLTSVLTGSSDIDAGVGEQNLNLIGSIDNYKIILDKGIGASTLDGETIKNSTYYGNGLNLIDIDGGIGSIKIDFVNN